MNIKQILFSTPMVQANLDGSKTQTRRVVKPQPNESGISYMKNPPLDWEQVYKTEWKPWKLETDEGETIALDCPYGQVGDILWVREKFCPTGSNELLHNETRKPFFYAADIIEKDFAYSVMKDYGWKMKPSIHMPKAACRIFLKITNVRVERLQDISEEDAKAEGVKLHKSGNHYLNYFEDKHRVTQFIYSCKTAKDSFASLWRIINGFRDEPFAWHKNPWVWVIEFERINLTPSEMNLFLNNTIKSK